MSFRLNDYLDVRLDILSLFLMHAVFIINSLTCLLVSKWHLLCYGNVAKCMKFFLMITVFSVNKNSTSRGGSVFIAIHHSIPCRLIPSPPYLELIAKQSQLCNMRYFIYLHQSLINFFVISLRHWLWQVMFS